MTPHVITLALWLAYIIAAESAQTCQQPRMSDIQVPANFNLEKFMGLWYELSWIPENWFPPEYNYDDYIAHFTRTNDSYIDFYWAGRETTGDEDCLHGNVYLVPLETAGKFTYVRVKNFTTGETLESEYWVTITDYDNYALVYGCRERGADDVCLEGKLDSWVWSRKTTMSAAHKTLVDNKIAELCINTTLFFTTEQVEACPYPGSDASDAPSHLTSLLCQILVCAWVLWNIRT